MVDLAQVVVQGAMSVQTIMLDSEIVEVDLEEVQQVILVVKGTLVEMALMAVMEVMEQLVQRVQQVCQEILWEITLAQVVKLEREHLV